MNRAVSTDAALPTGLVLCVEWRGKRSGMASPCLCGGRRYTCARCKRFVPECFGAADDLADLCDGCWGQVKREVAS